MEVFLKFLDYGAIGIALALAILSYRLLSKEQDQTAVREPMLNSINKYKNFALTLAVLFVVAEFIAPVFSKDNTAQKVESSLWLPYFGNSEFKDSTIELENKIEIISERLSNIPATTGETISNEADPERFQALEDSLSFYKKELSESKKGGFYKQIDLLNNTIDTYQRNGKGNSINIAYQPEKKEEIYNSLISIFSYLNKVRDGDGTRGTDGKPNLEKVRKIYCDFKKSYYVLPQEDSIKLQENLRKFEENKNYIIKADLAEMVKVRLYVED